MVGWRRAPLQRRGARGASDWLRHASRLLGHPIERPEPAIATGRKLASSVWGLEWCAHLERYSDFANRLPRGRTYLRRGSVLHVEIAPGEVRAVVLGSELYVQRISVRRLSADRIRDLAARCATIDAAMDLVTGKLPASVLHSIADPAAGLFPSPREIDLDCSCPDWADLCKHLAAVLYGIGVRFDTRPDLLFTLRGVEPEALIGGAKDAFVSTPPPPERRLARDDLAELFDIELEGAPNEVEEQPLHISRADLLELGLSASLIQTWLRRGWLTRTEARGVYEPTDDGWAELEPFLS